MAGPVTDRDQFERLYEDTRDDRLRYFLRRVQQPADAADLLADVFVVAWRRREQSHEEPRLWLYGVARNVLAAHRRGKQLQNSLAVRLRQQVAEQYEPSYEDLHVRELLSRLSPGDRELIELLLYDDLTPAEIATILGKNPGAVRVRIHRARQRLQVHLAAEQPDGNATAARG